MIEQPTFTVVHHVQGANVHRVTVPAVYTGITGHWFAGSPCSPSRDELARVMPHSLRPAIMRAPFWTTRDAPHLPQRADLWTVEHKPLGTLYAYPDWIDEAREGGAPAHYHGKHWLPFRDIAIGARFYHGATQSLYVKTSARAARMVSHGSGRVSDFPLYASVYKA